MEMDFSPEKRNERARSEFKERAGHHTEDLFDQDDDGNEKVDLATGKKFDNTTSKLPEEIRIASAEDVLKPIDEDDDSARAAEAWLNLHDPQRRKKDTNEAA